MDYPQVYRARCAYCGDKMYFDFWGMPIRQETPNGERREAVHRCDPKRGYYYVTEQKWQKSQKPHMKQRRAIAGIQGYHQQLVASILMIWALATHHQLTDLSGGNWYEALPE